MLEELLKRITKLRTELFLDVDLKRYEYSNDEQRAELREKYRLLKDTSCSRCGKNSRLSKVFYEHYKKYKLFMFIYYDIPREIDINRLRLLREC